MNDVACAKSTTQIQQLQQATTKQQTPPTTNTTNNNNRTTTINRPGECGYDKKLIEEEEKVGSFRRCRVGMVTLNFSRFLLFQYYG